jgi:hypothetical protein
MNFAKSTGEKGGLNYLRAMSYWHRPVGVFYEIIRKVKENGITDPTKLEGKNIELYIASLFGMGFEIDQKSKVWIAKPKNDPPDFVFMTLVFEEKERIYFHSREVEITRCLEKDDLFKIITKKDKPYPKDYILVCFLEKNGTLNVKELSQRLSGILKHIGHVFLVFHGVIDIKNFKDKSIEEIKKNISIVQLTPQYNTFTFNFWNYIESTKDDNEKLIYVKNGKVYYGKKDQGSEYPQILNELSD